MGVSKGQKGHQTEEALREYFLHSGYFVIRGAKFHYNNYVITDIDLWLYSRPSSFVRERVNVDIKSKRTPQAIERIFWAKGIQRVLGLEQCIVATTDKRVAVKTFGKEHDVTVLDGNFLDKLLRRYKYDSERMSEETLYNNIKTIKPENKSKDWKGKLEISKSILLNELSFDGCNLLLDACRYFMEEVMAVSEHRTLAGRILCLL